jgi:hypothetical protein
MVSGNCLELAMLFLKIMRQQILVNASSNSLAVKNISMGTFRRSHTSFSQA